MGDVLCAAKRSELMSRVKGKNTAPELFLRRAVWVLGIRYRIHKRLGRIKPDIVFGLSRVAVFVDGYFWHQCPLHKSMPKRNFYYWRTKLEQNVARDLEATKALTELVWKVLRFWEHEVYSSPSKCAQRVFKIVTIRLSKVKKTAD
jgi:DNA mismatch endonuclease (patch repair protein)